MAVCSGSFKAFSSEVDTGSREENASKQESGVDQRFHEKLKDSRERRDLLAVNTPGA
jgi:hypothetical protein